MDVDDKTALFHLLVVFVVQAIIRGFTQMTSDCLGIAQKQLGKNMQALPRLARCPGAPDLDNWQDNACTDSSDVVFSTKKTLLALIPIHTAPNYFLSDFINDTAGAVINYA